MPDPRSKIRTLMEEFRSNELFWIRVARGSTVRLGVVLTRRDSKSK